MTRTLRIEPGSVAELEPLLADALATLEVGDELVCVGMPVPGLDGERDGDAWHYVAPVGARRASSDETHRVAVLHPQYDGFLSLELRARRDLGELRVVPDEPLSRAITPHQLLGPIGRGQQRAVDLELHPGNIAAGGVQGALRIVDEAGDDAAPPVLLTLAVDRSVECVLAGEQDGPWSDPRQLRETANELVAGRGSARRLALRIERMREQGSDPGWGRLRRWRR